MIPQIAIQEWREQRPWKSAAQVEQDLLISRPLVAIFSDDYLGNHLAFRGGTALHKLYFTPAGRYSEDPNLVQVNAEPIKETYDRTRDVPSFLGEPRVKQKKHNNCKEHFSVLPMRHVPFGVESMWFPEYNFVAPHWARISLPTWPISS